MQADPKDGMERLGNYNHPKHQELDWTTAPGGIPMHTNHLLPTQASFSIYQEQDQYTLLRAFFKAHVTVCLLW